MGELDALICEEILSCPKGEDIVSDKNESSANGTVIVKSKDRLEFANSHYESARLGLEELMVRYGKMKAAENLDLTKEGGDISFAVMLVVGTGNKLADERMM